MRERQTTRIVLVLVLLSSFVLAGCDGAGRLFDKVRSKLQGTSAEEYIEQLHASQTPRVSAAATKNEGVLTIGVKEFQTPPFVIANDAEIDGLDVDVACALADELGLSASFVRVSDVRTALEGPCDIVMGATPAEANGFGLVGGYAQNASALFQYGADTPPATADQVRGSNVAVQDGSAAQQVLQRLSFGTNEVPSTSLTDAFDKLARAEANYAACSLAAGSYVADQRGGVSVAGLLEEPTQAVVAVAAGEQELLGALTEAYARMERNGLLNEARRLWVSPLGADATQINGLTAPVDPVAPSTEEQATQERPEEAPAAQTAPQGEIIAGGNAVELK